MFAIIALVTFSTFLTTLKIFRCITTIAITAILTFSAIYTVGAIYIIITMQQIILIIFVRKLFNTNTEGCVAKLSTNTVHQNDTLKINNLTIKLDR